MIKQKNNCFTNILTGIIAPLFHLSLQVFKMVKMLSMPVEASCQTYLPLKVQPLGSDDFYENNSGDQAL